MALNRDAILRVGMFSNLLQSIFSFLGHRGNSFSLHKHVKSNENMMLSCLTLVPRVLMVPWLPWSYILSQITIIFLGFSAIINRESAIHVELVRLTSI